MIALSIKETAEKYERQEINLVPGQEFRILHQFARNVYIRLLDGSAEIFGSEMIYHPYRLPSDIKSISVFSLYGARIEILFEEATKNYLRFYLHTDEDNYHAQVFGLNAIFEAHRKHALNHLQEGPRILVVGSENSGKFTLIRTLINYAVKNEWKPIFADLDPVESRLATFGTISATVVSEFMPYTFTELSKLAFFFGYDSLKDRFDFYSKQVRILTAQINQKNKYQLENFKIGLINGLFLSSEDQSDYVSLLQTSLDDLIKKQASSVNGKQILDQDEISQKILGSSPEEISNLLKNKMMNHYLDKEIFASGIFYDLPNEVSNFKPPEIREIIEIIDPQYVIIIANDYLKYQIEQASTQRQMSIIRFPKNTGISWLDTAERKEIVGNNIQNHFNSEQLMCIRDVILISDLTIYQIESACNLPLKYITAVSEKNLILTKIDLTITDIRGKFLGLVNLLVSERIEIEDIMNSELIALIYVIDSDGKTISLKRPQGIIENYTKFVLCVGNLSL